jgi:hypothetical protein
MKAEEEGRRGSMILSVMSENGVGGSSDGWRSRPSKLMVLAEENEGREGVSGDG